MDIEKILGVEELRGRALEHTRRAFGMLPAMDRPRILDIGCGKGQQTMELARLSCGDVIGIDIDETALARLRTRLDESGLSGRLTVRRCSLFDSGLAAGSFDIVWEEGVLHLLDTAASLAECHRLLKPNGFLVMHEQIVWFDGVRERLSEWGMILVGQHSLPKHFWWTNYGAPLEERIKTFRRVHPSAANSPELTRYAGEAAMIKADLDRFDCAFFIVQKRRQT